MASKNFPEPNRNTAMRQERSIVNDSTEDTHPNNPTPVEIIKPTPVETNRPTSPSNNKPGLGEPAEIPVENFKNREQHFSNQ